MQKQTLNALGIIFLLITAINTATGGVTLVRFGPEGEENQASSTWKVSFMISRAMSAKSHRRLCHPLRDAIAQLSLDDLPAVAGEPRLGVPLTGIGKIGPIGFIT